jgi:hypothetical protein
MNVIESIQAQCTRCRELIEEYKKIGPTGAFGAAMIQRAITEGEQAVASDDAVRMLRAYKALEDCE